MQNLTETRKYFGTDGIRGVYGEDLTDGLAMLVGNSLGLAAAGGTVVIGRDNRTGGENLARALAEGVLAAAGNVVDLGVVTTPCVSFVTRETGASAGVMVSASHNPPRYNGIKVFGPDGRKLAREREALVEKHIADAKLCYAEYRGEVMLIDKHAAHERIIFEQLKESRGKDGRIGSQTLIVPLEITLTGEEIAAVKEYRDDFIAVGFDILPEIGDKTVTVTAIPDATEISDAKDIFVKMAGELSDGTGNPELNDSIRREKALYQIACKAAVKGGRVYDRSVIDWIVSRLIEYPEIIVCPHGRPVAVKLTKNELDKLFERIK